MAKEAESKRELQAVQAELIEAEVFQGIAAFACVSLGASFFVSRRHASGMA